jgi:transcriptional regulator GlxA family with amidase domain
MAIKKPIEIGLVLYPGAQLAAVYGLLDLFSIANRFDAKHNGREKGLLCVSQWHLNASENMPTRESATLEVVGGAPTVLILPPTFTEPPTLQDARPFVSWLLSSHRAGAMLASICGGAFVLGETGLLNGRSATTHWAHADVFKSRFPEARLDVDRLVIDDGDIVTAGGLMAWIDLGLKLVDRFLGPTIMLDTARFLLVDPPGREQRYYSAFSPNLTHGDAAVLKAQHWLQATGAVDMTLATIASQAGLEERSFLRRFRKATGLTAVDYCQRLRVGKASELLQFGSMPIEKIAWEVGYSDLGAFRKVFVRVTGLTPGRYRRRFSASST